MITVSPDPFTLIKYSAADIGAIAEDAAAFVGLPSGVDIQIDVDEELFAPLVGHFSDVVDSADAAEPGMAERGSHADRKLVIWISGGNFEDSRNPLHFSPAQAKRDLTLALFRGKDRLSDDFKDAPPDRELSRAERAAWDAYSNGRASRLGVATRHQASLYEFRLQHGFTDVADAAFDRLWEAPSMTWSGIREICKETGAADRDSSKIPVDLLRQK